MSDAALIGARVLLVEDESLVAMLGEDVLIEAGCEVTVAMRLAEALAAVEATRFDFAILDVNLGDATSYPVAEALSARRIPFAFATGYAAKGLANGFSACPCVQKPYGPQELVAAARALLAH
ncbi:response regulator [Limimaricola pyoseonensis]|uniref:Response regulator receiver domain-containing protein n=1 Tax=Limimaricola pyoseonensis TaxID=521013 RepID=A0A1G7G9G5_9RHOB|nr:response regulator [Limimaricola pyoseonensis]SDE84776.1 Response regulator receiver domain-containing protein [Limimaricola pyoseonensis]